LPPPPKCAASHRPKHDSVVAGATYDVRDPTIVSQIVKLKASGADVLVIAATPKFAALSIRKAFEIGWKPMTFLSNVAVAKIPPARA
jgi:branched-chain amino acid transport system substrate-binding protein